MGKMTVFKQEEAKDGKYIHLHIVNKEIGYNAALAVQSIPWRNGSSLIIYFPLINVFQK